MLAYLHPICCLGFLRRPIVFSHGVDASGLISNEKEICSVEAASAEDIDKAVAAARVALHHESWRDISGTDRGQLMFKLADLAVQEKEVLATIETWDNGKPYGDALGDLDEVINCIRYYAGWADKIYGQTIPTTAQKFAYTLKQPIGVCGQIIPVSWMSFGYSILLLLDGLRGYCGVIRALSR